MLHVMHVHHVRPTTSTACWLLKAVLSVSTAGSCGYTESDGKLPFPEDSVAAAADTNIDFAGSCGRCYEFKCVDGLIYGMQAKVECVGWWWAGRLGQ